LNKDKIKEYRRNRYYANLDLEKQYAKKYAEENRPELNAYRREYEKERVKTDDIYKFKKSIRCLISNSIKNKGFTKKSRVAKILGCSFNEFINYVESKFRTWMNWSNHGKYTGDYNQTWQLDHIIPISSAKSEIEVIELNHYTNFQPICSKINNEKSNRIL
jgi:5-methylcytosine-specific restriction endonuclease McrA